MDAKSVLCVLTNISNPEFIHAFCTHLPNTLPDGGLGFSSTVSLPDRTPLKTDGATFPMRSTQQTKHNTLISGFFAGENFFPFELSVFFLNPLADICSYLNHKCKELNCWGRNITFCRVIKRWSKSYFYILVNLCYYIFKTYSLFHLFLNFLYLVLNWPSKTYKDPDNPLYTILLYSM